MGLKLRTKAPVGAIGTDGASECQNNIRIIASHPDRAVQAVQHPGRTSQNLKHGGFEGLKRRPNRKPHGRFLLSSSPIVIIPNVSSLHTTHPLSARLHAAPVEPATIFEEAAIESQFTWTTWTTQSN